MSRGGIRLPTPEWLGYDIDPDDVAHWTERVHVGELAPDAPATQAMRDAIRPPRATPA